jgi:hypothetical protein
VGGRENGGEGETMKKVEGIYVCDRTKYWGAPAKNIRAVYASKENGPFIIKKGKKISLTRLSLKKHSICYENIPFGAKR